jgi:hypothetical protein
MDKNKNNCKQTDHNESLLEDIILAEAFGSDIEEAECGNTKTHCIEKPEDIFKLL